MQTRGNASVLGLDISQYQGITDAELLFSSMPNYIYLRAFGSANNVDTKFHERVNLAKSYGVPSGAYYFAHPSKALGNGGEAEADAQATQFANLLQEAYGVGNYGDLIPMLDVEAWGSVTPQYPMYYGLTGLQIVAWVERFRDTFWSKTKRRLGFYSNRYFMTDPTQLGLTDAQFTSLSNMPLWLAEYDRYYPNNTIDTNAPSNFGGWTTYVLWQYEVIADATSHGLSHGQNEVDHNRTDSVDRLKPPSPPTNTSAKQTGDNQVTFSFVHPTDTDYNGTSLYVNGVWKKWIGKANPSTFTFDITSYQRNKEISYQFVSEDYTADFGYSTIKKLRIFQH